MSIPKSHYFEARPSTASKPRTVRLRTGDLDLELQADRGVFGSKAVDLGTLILLKEGPPPPPNGELLDLGCGYGAIAITLARRSPRSHVWAVDVNERGLELAKSNAEAAGVENISIGKPEDVPEMLRFEAIYSNPPVRVGKAQLHALLLEWLARLQPEGAAFLVVQRNLGSDSLATWLAGQGFGVNRLRSKKGYRILEVRRASS